MMTTLERAAWLLTGALALPTGLLLGRVYGPRRAVCYAAGVAGAVAVQDIFTRAMRRRLGPEDASPADLLTLSRGLCGAMLAGLVAADIRDRAGPAGWLGFLPSLLGATLSDWLDGPLARRAGPTRLGAVLDIEADSWLTLWSAMAAVRWGGLPRWCLLAPVLRYLHPAFDLLEGGAPAGGGPWWSRVTGTAQMTLFVVALAPLPHDGGRAPLRRAAVVISGGQGATLLVLLWRRRRRR
jgi:phosphatidylglycerophosphate synthase